MNKKEKINLKEFRNQNHESMKMSNGQLSRNKKNEKLPWWVELLFVQIGLPDKIGRAHV